MTFFLDGPPPPTRSADRAQEAVVVGLGLVQLGRELAACLAWQLVPPPMREWLDWMGSGARWSVR